MAKKFTYLDNISLRDSQNNKISCQGYQYGYFTLSRGQCTNHLDKIEDKIEEKMVLIENWGCSSDGNFPVKIWLAMIWSAILWKKCEKIEQKIVKKLCKELCKKIVKKLSKKFVEKIAKKMGKKLGENRGEIMYHYTQFEMHVT